MQDEKWQRRQAVQVAAMLPDDEASATRVLELAMVLVKGFLSGNDDPEQLRPM